MLPRYKIILGGLFLCISKTVTPLTINATLAQYGDIDIYISKNAPNNLLALHSLRIGQSHIPIMTYSFFMDAHNRINFWKTPYDTSTKINISHLNALYPAPDRIQLPKKLASPLPIILSADEIEALTGEALTQVYVIIFQRTYYFDTISQSIAPFSQVLLSSGFHSVNDTITLTAQGSINQSMWSVFPIYLKNIYAAASGNVS